MIYGVGTDIVAVQRIADALERHGERFAWRILAEGEREAYRTSTDPARFLAKRFAAKEAFGKALGIGVAAPATLHASTIAHDERGKPYYDFSPQLAAVMSERSLKAHLSLSDERDYVVAFALLDVA